MRISEILSRKGARVLAIGPDATLRDAIRRLAEARVGALLVSEDDKRIDGILSERDVVRVQADAALDVDRAPVREAMTAEVISCSPDTSIEEAMKLMNERRIRHLPVLENGELAGLVSVRDVIDARLLELQVERDQMENYVSGEFGVSGRLSP